MGGTCRRCNVGGVLKVAQPHEDPPRRHWRTERVDRGMHLCRSDHVIQDQRPGCPGDEHREQCHQAVTRDRGEAKGGRAARSGQERRRSFDAMTPTTAITRTTMMTPTQMPASKMVPIASHAETDSVSTLMAISRSIIPELVFMPASAT